MSKCGKGCMPECGYFTTGGCVSPFNCPYRIEELSPNSATSVSSIYVQNLISENAVLKTENAALQKRLENAVELPKIGDEIYIIEDGYCDCAEVCEIHIQEKDTIVEWVQWDRSNYETPEFYDEGEVLMSEYNKTWFTDRAKAEARLEELKGGRE